VSALALVLGLFALIAGPVSAAASPGPAATCLPAPANAVCVPGSWLEDVLSALVPADQGDLLGTRSGVGRAPASPTPPTTSPTGPRRSPDKGTVHLRAGDALRVLTPGGGGWGAELVPIPGRGTTL